MNLDIKFMSYRRFATIVSVVLLILSIGSLSFKGLNLGLDFSGGTLIEVSYDDAADLSEIRDLMFNNGFDDFQVVNFGANSDVLIKVADKDDQLTSWLRQMSNERFRHVPVVDKSGKLINVMSQGDFVSYTWPNLVYQVKEMAKENYFKANQVVLIIVCLLVYTLITTVLAMKLV